MGCAAEQHEGISIQNNIVALVISGNTDLLIKKIDSLGNDFDPNTPLNFRGDTILHYGCQKNNEKLVKYLVNHPKTLKSSRNNQQKMPKDLTTNENIKKLCQ